VASVKRRESGEENEPQIRLWLHTAQYPTPTPAKWQVFLTCSIPPWGQQGPQPWGTPTEEEVGRPYLKAQNGSASCTPSHLYTHHPTSSRQLLKLQICQGVRPRPQEQSSLLGVAPSHAFGHEHEQSAFWVPPFTHGNGQWHPPPSAIPPRLQLHEQSASRSL
jgi:hypothetical protein